MYEYKSRRMRGRLFRSDDMETEKVDNYLNESAKEGWRLHAMSTSVGSWFLGTVYATLVDVVLEREVATDTKGDTEGSNTVDTKKSVKSVTSVSKLQLSTLGTLKYQCKICHHIYVADIEVTECPNCGSGKSMQKKKSS